MRVRQPIERAVELERAVSPGRRVDAAHEAVLLVHLPARVHDVIRLGADHVVEPRLHRVASGMHKERLDACGCSLRYEHTVASLNIATLACAEISMSILTVVILTVTVHAMVILTMAMPA